MLEWPVSVTGIQHFEIFYIYIIFEHVFINNIYLFEWFVSRALEKENDFWVIFLLHIQKQNVQV